MRDAFGNFVGNKVYTDIREACKALKLDRKAVKRNIRVEDGNGEFMLGYPELVFTAWEDDDTLLGPVGMDYMLVQYMDSFDIAQPCIDKGFKIVGGGPINRGERAVLILESTQPFEISLGVKIVNRVLLTSSHNGSGKINVRMAPYFEKAKTAMNVPVPGLSFKHTKKVHERMAAGRKTFKKVNAAWDDFTDASKRMMAIKLTDEEARNFIASVLPSDKKEITTRLENIREDIYQNWKNTGISRTFPACSGTLFGLVMAFAEWADHKKVIRASKNRNEEAEQFDAKFINDGAKKKAAAFAAAKKLMKLKSLKGGLSGATLKQKVA